MTDQQRAEFVRVWESLQPPAVVWLRGCKVTEDPS